MDGTAFVGSHGGTVYALDTADGSEVWTYETGGEVRSAPAVVNGTVYVGSGRASGQVHAISIDGDTQWSKVTSGAAMSVVVANGSVYTGGYDGVLYAFR